jgi:hypothetical protein
MRHRFPPFLHEFVWRFFLWLEDSKLAIFNFACGRVLMTYVSTFFLEERGKGRRSVELHGAQAPR